VVGLSDEPDGNAGSVVVVGIDGTGAANDALDWATAEAAARGCRLRATAGLYP
jgi:nucleotide-binding universal stress UspA family protein